MIANNLWEANTMWEQLWVHCAIATRNGWVSNKNLNHHTMQELNNTSDWLINSKESTLKHWSIHPISIVQFNQLLYLLYLELDTSKMLNCTCLKKMCHKSIISLWVCTEAWSDKSIIQAHLILHWNNCKMISLNKYTNKWNQSLNKYN